MKKKHDESEHEGSSERWLLTYSDMITLLLALFIILYSMSNIEKEKLEALSRGFSAAFHTSGGANEGSGTGFESGIGTGMEDSLTADSGTGDGSDASGLVPPDPLDEVYQILTEYIDENHLENEIGLVNTDKYVRIHLKDMLMFVPDKADLLSQSKPIISKIGDALMRVYDRVDQITISGHTADVGSHTAATDAFSWNLSINRADTVRRSLVECGLKENKLSLQGYGHYQPIASNDTEEGRAQNRRVEISIYRYSPDSSNSPDNQ
ncbi:MAG: chemotaxis protein MotB [Oscillospiraceae bacterium]|nr:chemotaxis protein MotB [Oscillospiraceae bacterium]